MESELTKVSQEIGVGHAGGQVGVFVYQMDNDSREFYMVAQFENREAYQANAASPQQHQRFMKLMTLLEGEPEWHDGEIVYSTTGK